MSSRFQAPPLPRFQALPEYATLEALPPLTVSYHVYTSLVLFSDRRLIPPNPLQKGRADLLMVEKGE